MNNTDYLAFCQNELRRSKRWRQSKVQDYEGDWKRYIQLYQGKHYDAKNKVDQLTVNLVFSTINTMAPAVAINNPKFVVHARDERSYDQSVITEEVLNYLWRTHHYQREFRLAVLDWMLVGHGWLKVGYKATKPPEAKKAEGEPDSTDEGSEEGIDDREDVEGQTESEMIFHEDEDRPFVERISVFDMYVDPDARHPKEMRWVAQRTWRAVQDVKVDERYSATNRKRVSPHSHSRWDHDEGDARSDEDNPDRGAISYCEIIEFYDLKRKTVATFATSTGEEKNGFLIKPKPIPYSFGHPFVMLRNFEVPDHFYPIGDVAQIESLQLELNETRNQMLNYRKKFRRAWVYAKDLFDRDGIQALESDEDNVAIPVQADDPSKAIVPVPAAITPPEFFDQSAMISDDIDRVSGVSDYQRGAQTAIKRTATEAAMIQDAANARAQDRLAKVEGILAEVGERVVQTMQQFLAEDQVARIVTLPVDGWIKYGPEWIQGRFTYEVVGGSTEPQNETFRRQSAMQIVDMSVPFMQQGVVNMPQLYMELLRYGFGRKDPQRFVQAPPPPQPEAPPEGPPQGEMPPEEMMGQQPIDPRTMDPEQLLQLVNAGMPPGGDMAGQAPIDPRTMDPEALLALIESGGMPPMA